MIIQVDKASGAALSFDYINVIEDIERFTPSYISVVEVTKSYLDGMTKSQLQKMAVLGAIPYDDSAAKTDLVKLILNFNPEE